MRRLTSILLLLALTLTACGRTDRPTTPRARAEPLRPSTRETAQCQADLRREGVDYRELPPKDYGNGCGLYGAVQLTDIGVPVTGVTAMRCGAARAFAGWVRNAVAPAAYQVLGSELARVEGMGTYACRNIVGTRGMGDRRSGHALANAVDIGVPVTGVTAMRCGAARAFAGWVRNAVAPAAYQILGSELARVEGMGTYACRNIVGTRGMGDRRSGHALANAVDVGGFVLKDGRRITILRDWSSPDPDTQRFMQAIRTSACRRFGTVLTPNYNAAHRNHLHLEDDRARFCR